MSETITTFRPGGNVVYLRIGCLEAFFAGFFAAAGALLCYWCFASEVKPAPADRQAACPAACCQCAK